MIHRIGISTDINGLLLFIYSNNLVYFNEYLKNGYRVILFTGCFCFNDNRGTIIMDGCVNIIVKVNAIRGK